MLNVKFNVLNKQIYNVFPFPWCVLSLVSKLGFLLKTPSGLCRASTLWLACS